MTRANLKSQSGAIMLEVIAVLSLMGLMGTILYRQIYQRNQELHNIQMASEIRVVKEAFSAWIQANSVVLQTHCAPPAAGSAWQCSGANLPIAGGGTIQDAVAAYLPDGYFFSSGAHPGDYLKDNYDLQVWGYDRGDAALGRAISTYYGIVVPKPNVLPDGGSGETWNFRRAARVAMLVGIDGGAYGHGITVENSSDEIIAGAVGTWSLPIQVNGTDVIITECSNNCTSGNNSKDCDNNYCPTYVAITGLDVFQPEIDLPDVAVNLPQEWNLVLQNLGAYGRFVVGNDRNCYGIGHHNTIAQNANMVVNDDTITTSSACLPAFYVEDETGGAGGNVRVLNDLTIGQEYDNNGNPKDTAGLQLTREGIIKQKDGLTIDKDGRIIARETVSADIGDLKQGEHYVVDPAYTSTMNDIRLASRGGVRLSDILPNYILKEQKTISCTINAGSSSCSDNDTQVSRPNCPQGYNKALVVIPTKFGKNIVDSSVTGTAASVTPSSTNHEHSHGVTGTAIRHQFRVTLNANGTHPSLPIEDNTNGGIWAVEFSYDNNVSENETIEAIAQTYCVWRPSVYDGNENACKAAGYTYTANKCTETRVVDSTMDGSVKGAERSQAACVGAGFTWIGNANEGHCRYTYDAGNITAIASGANGNPALAEKICKQAGLRWTGESCVQNQNP